MPERPPSPWWPGTVWIAVGLNLPPRAWRWRRARRALAALPRLTPLTWAPVLENAAVGPGVRGRFWNSVVRCRVETTPLRLLERLKLLEKHLGRRRAGADRPADFDLLLWRDELGWRHLETPRLSLPHPRMRSRPFVLAPLAAVLDADPPPELRGALTYYGASGDTPSSVSDPSARSVRSSPDG